MNIKTIARHTRLPMNALLGRTAIVVDVLRATTSITWALQNGAAAVIPTVEPAEAVGMASRIGGCVLAGERGALKIPGFDLSNSPLEFTASAVRGKNVIMTTTNGTSAICAAEGAANVLIGCMINCAAVARRAVELGQDVIIICAGTEGEISADDIFAAGAIALEIARLSGGAVQLCDTTMIACMVYDNWKDDFSMFSHTHHYSRLVGMGLGADVELCLRRDVTDKVPELRDGVIR